MNLVFLLAVIATFCKGQDWSELSDTNEAELAQNWPQLREARLAQGPRGNNQVGDYCQTIQPYGMASCAPGLRCVDNKCTRYMSEAELAQNLPQLREARLAQGPRGQSQEGDYCQTIQPNGQLRRCATGLRCVNNRCTRYTRYTSEAEADLALLSALLNENGNSVESALQAEAETSGASWLYDTHILFTNRLNRPIYVKGMCDHKLLTKETKDNSAKLEGEYNGIKGSLELKRSVSRDFKHIIQKAGYTRIGAYRDWTGYYPVKGKKDVGCQPVYVSYYVDNADGTIELKQNSGQTENGKKMIFKGTADNPWIQRDLMCHGSYKDCGCYKGYCMSKCGWLQGLLGKYNKEWCYTTKGRKNDRKWVTCQEHKHCRPDWSCGGHCSIGW